jgi:hypothetical protein
VTSRAALPPAQLDAVPDAPDAFDAVALSDTRANLSWARPPGNPKVDSYSITAVPANATGCAALTVLQ